MDGDKEKKREDCDDLDGVPENHQRVRWVKDGDMVDEIFE